ncbi:SAM-dependent methyltransferase [Methanosarcina horonobensis]|uniref:SAM-dependent methyltransferase n=1 Tax=Methanosarcina horonobensis TaxID=418008 RepID=UPI000AE633EA|nr:methyltransferase domain-containing protein [Methanosarcina horonobensis]
MLHNLFPSIFSQTSKPPLFEPGELQFWNDPHISKSMLEAHLDQTHDRASRRTAEIEKTVSHLTYSGFLKTGDRVLDLGCGPGLYSSRLCLEGVRVTGIDISRRSIDYARTQAEKEGLDIDYICADFFSIEYEETFDAVLQAYGEICTFSDEKRNILLSLIHRALKDRGFFSFLTCPQGCCECGKDSKTGGMPQKAGSGDRAGTLCWKKDSIIRKIIPG